MIALHLEKPETRTARRARLLAVTGSLLFAAGMLTADPGPDIERFLWYSYALFLPGLLGLGIGWSFSIAAWRRLALGPSKIWLILLLLLVVASALHSLARLNWVLNEAMHLILVLSSLAWTTMVVRAALKQE